MRRIGLYLMMLVVLAAYFDFVALSDEPAIAQPLGAAIRLDDASHEALGSASWVCSSEFGDTSKEGLSGSPHSFLGSPRNGAASPSPSWSA
jgi:hypothetical protein